MSYYIIVFKNTHDAMAGEKKLKEEGYNIRIMPTPTSITQSCGICIRIEEEKVINEVIRNNNLTYKNIYIKDGDFKVIK